MNQLDEILASSLDGKVPKSAYQDFIIARIKEFLFWQRLNLDCYGYPSGYFVVAPPDIIQTLKTALEKNHVNP
jgi:hypothetical protein